MSLVLYNSSYSKPRVSDDVLLLIIDAVGSGPGSRKTLSACALICRAARQRSQVHLFDTIALTRGIQCKLLARAIFARQELGQLVKHLSFSCAKGWKRERFEDHPLPPHIVTALTNLTSAKFVGFRLESVADEYDPPALVSFVITFGSLTSLTELAVYGMKFHRPTDLYRLSWSFPSVKKLVLERCWTYWGGDFDVLPSKYFYPGHCRSLQFLDLFTSCPPPFVLGPMWGRSVQGLSLRLWSEGAVTADDYAGLQHFTALRRLELCLHPDALPIDWFDLTFQYIASKHVKKLVIHHETYPAYTYTKLHTKLGHIALGEGASDVLKTFEKLEQVLWVVHCYHAELGGECQCGAFAIEIEASVPAPWLRKIFSVIVDDDRTYGYVKQTLDASLG